MRHVDPLAYVNAPYIFRADTDSPSSITIKVVQGVYHGVTTVELDVRVLRFTFWTRLTRRLLIEPRRRDRRIPHHTAPRLRCARRAYRHLQPSQGDDKELLPGGREAVQLWCVRSPRGGRACAD